jgi:hypothetical protein
MKCRCTAVGSSCKGSWGGRVFSSHLGGSSSVTPVANKGDFVKLTGLNQSQKWPMCSL